MNFLTEMSYREQSIAAELIIEIGAITYFVKSLLALPNSAELNINTLAPIVSNCIIGAIVAAIVLFSAIALFKKEEPKDERDYRLDAKSSGIAYTVLFVMIIAVTWIIVGESYTAVLNLDGDIQISHVVLLLLAALSASSMAKSVSQLYFYKWGNA